MTGRFDAEHQLWTRNFHPAPPGAPRLICLPHAGGSASFYFPLSKALAPEVDVLTVQYPGRQDRRLEPPAESIGALADGLCRVLEKGEDVPLAIFGHSMGALVGFELARRLEAEGRPPAALFVSGRRGPATERDETVHTRDDAGLIAEVRSLGGTDLTALQDEDLVEMILPVLRADYRVVETYRRGPGPRLSCPITVMTGDNDPKVTSEEAWAWAQETSGPFEVLVHPGGHFYLTSRQEAVIAQIAARMRQTVPAPGTAV